MPRESERIISPVMIVANHSNDAFLEKQAEAARQGIAESISPASVRRFLNFAGIAPWKNRYKKNWTH